MCLLCVVCYRVCQLHQLKLRYVMSSTLYLLKVAFDLCIWLLSTCFRHVEHYVVALCGVLQGFAHAAPAEAQVPYVFYLVFAQGGI